MFLNICQNFLIADQQLRKEVETLLEITKQVQVVDQSSEEEDLQEPNSPCLKTKEDKDSDSEKDVNEELAIKEFNSFSIDTYKANLNLSSKVSNNISGSNKMSFSNTIKDKDVTLNQHSESTCKNDALSQSIDGHNPLQTSYNAVAPSSFSHQNGNPNSIQQIIQNETVKKSKSQSNIKGKIEALKKHQKNLRNPSV